MIEIKEIFKALADNAGKLSDNQIAFVQGLQRYYNKYHTLSGKQLAVLKDLTQYSIAAPPLLGNTDNQGINRY